MYRLRVGILKAKQLKKFKLKKELRVVTKFVERNIGKYYKIVIEKYFIKDHPINIT